MNAARTAAEGALFYSLERREAWNEAAQPAWEGFAQAQNTETIDPIAPNFEGDPNYGRLRELGRAKRAQSNLYRMRGEPENAVAAALDGVEMGIAMASGGALLGRWVSAAIVDNSIAAINDTDRLPDRLEAPVARAAMERLEQSIDRLVPWRASIERERDFRLAELQRAFESEDWRARYSWETPADNWRERARRRLTSRQRIAADIARAADTAADTHNVPYWRPTAPDGCARADRYGYQSARFVAALERTRLDLLLLRLALCAYRGERGAYPRFLGELNGDYLRRVPFDPFAIEPYGPYRYSFADASYCLWSVGPDGEDDGGRPIAFERAPARGLPWNKGLPQVGPDSKGDIVAGENR